MRYLSLLFLSLLLIGCSSEKEEQYNEVFVLAFEEGKSVVYDYHQRYYESTDDEPETIDVYATLEIKGIADNEGSMVLKNMKVKRVGDEDLFYPDEDEVTGDLDEIDGIKPNGEIDGTTTGSNPFSFMFTLPSKDLKIGEYITEEMTYPIVIGDVKTDAIATKIITYLKDTIIAGKNCPVISFSIEGNSLKDKSLVTAESYVTWIGHGTSYFDTNRKQFVGSTQYSRIICELELKDGSDYLSMETVNELVIWVALL
jgi:hypothetical protein